MYRRHGDGKLIVSATDLVGFLECGHLTELERAAARGLVPRPNRKDPEVELLRRRGFEHELRYIREKLAGKRITSLPDKDDAGEDLPLETRAAQTVEAMQRGDEVIFQATFFDGKWRGHADFLLREPAPKEESAASLSTFARSGEPDVTTEPDVITRRDSEPASGVRRQTGLGADWIYEIADTKLARSAKASALIQICSYVDQIEQVQGVNPVCVYVVTGGGEIEVHPFRTAEMMAYYRHAKARFEAAIDDEISGAPTYPIDRQASYPDPVEHCAVCRWYPDYCRVQWRDDDALKLVAGITRAQRQELRTRGIDSRASLATATLPFEPPVKTSSLESFSRIKEQARVQVASDGLDVPVSELLLPARDSQDVLVADRGLSALPKPDPGDLFFDIEGDPFAFWAGLEYLFGIWEPGTGDGLWDSGAYRELWALNRAEEKQKFEQVMDLFVARLEQYPRMHIYHYAPYEPTALKRLAGRHATREEELDDLLRKRVFVDLYRVVRQGLRAGVESYSIKRLEPLYGYRREIELRDANSSIVEFEQVLEVGDPDGKIKEQIALYNRDDCISTLRLRDWLEERRVEAADTWGELPRPPTEVQPTSEELTARQAEVRALEEKLTAGITNDPTAQSEADRATWLMAHLLDWHRREQKSTFWRFYDLMSKSDDELFEEAEPIGRLEFIEKTDPGGRARSHDYHYRFAPQEHKVDTGLEVHDPQLVEKTKTGTVEAIDKDAGTIVIRRPKDWAGQHPTSIVPLNVFRAKDQQTALMRLGEWVAENGIDSPSDDYRAARDLLLRRPPRAGQSDGQSLVRVAEQESGTAAAQRLALELDGTTLAVQGPPGSGKTYTGAQMILALMGDVVRGGRRVGMTSNSHKVIGNLVEAACDAAEDAEVELRVVQKGKEHEVFTHRFVKGVGDNDDVRSALEADDALVAAGTPWLWADPDLRGSLDTLFVDEAGQVSLANVVAMAGSARNIVLLGDPQQLDQPTQGEHPEGAGVSALGHFLGTEETVSDKRGVFLEKTWRMHPRITGYTSELFYEGRLTTIDGLDRQEVHGDGEFVGSGIRWVPVKHTGNTNESEEEADRVAEIWKSLIGRQWTDREGVTRMIEAKDIVIISPFNAHRLLIQERLPTGARVGTVDKFQGQEAAVSIYTMATSRPEDAPRGIDFLYSLNRLNVATSRARALAIVVASPYLLDMVPHSPKQLSMANGLCAFVEAAPPV